MQVRLCKFTHERKQLNSKEDTRHLYGTIILDKVARPPSSCRLEVADYIKNYECRIVALQLRATFLLESCGIVVAELLSSNCGIAIADNRKSRACPLLIRSNTVRKGPQIMYNVLHYKNGTLLINS